MLSALLVFGALPPTLKDLLSVALFVVLGGIGIACGITSEIITSPEGLEYTSIGWRVSLAWPGIKEVRENESGIVNLVSKESLYRSRIVNSLLHPLGADRMIQLSPFIQDIGSSNLLKEIARYAPDTGVAELIARHPITLRAYQKVGGIGFYYVGLLLVSVVLAAVMRQAADKLTSIGFVNMTMVSTIASIGFLVGIFLTAGNLLGYNAEIAGLSERQVRARAGRYYVAPIMLLLASLAVGLILWIVLRAFSLELSEGDFGIVGGLVAIALFVPCLRFAELVSRWWTDGTTD